jgi:hypothetical protein
MIIDLLDYQVGSLCDVCGSEGRHELASMRSMDGVPVCDSCAVVLLQVERVLRDLCAVEVLP